MSGAGGINVARRPHEVSIRMRIADISSLFIISGAFIFLFRI